MTDTNENAEVTALDRHAPTPPADEADAPVAQDTEAAPATEDTPIKPLDRHAP
jgi:hypothetical protein